MNRGELNELIDALIEGSISEADFLRLEAELSVDSEAREAYYDRLTLSALLEIEAGASPQKIVPMPVPTRRWWPALTAIAAAVAALAAVGSMIFKTERANPIADKPVEMQSRGFAVLTGQSAAVWKGAAPLADGALLPAGRMHLASGVAQLELFSGVSVVIEGEAEFEVLSPMEMKVARGKVRAHVPEAAHGFRIHTAEGEVVDLGTEFALEVSPERSDVHVLDGKVEWHSRTDPMRLMAKGEALRSTADGKSVPLAANARSFLGIAELKEKLSSARETRRADWMQFSETLRHDPRLALYYRMSDDGPQSRHVSNTAAATANTGADGAIVAATRVPDRWGTPGGALDFSPAGSRVRVNVPGEYRSITLLTWVKINSLDRWYNSLFLTDGAKVTQPHWQIMDDGRLFFSVKKRERAEVKKGERDKYHFMSPPFWSASLSGQWLMIATTYDVDARKVAHYLNGKVLSEEAIPEEYLVEKVTIGAASLCNWSEPVYRTDAKFAVRNLNGSMDEFALFSAALSPKEIEDIYEHGKP
ncbi:MAG: LamG-like jellyroll fold domain-containing protein [Chthoniobacteraceae bacterium]